jgi:hypothetical protein
MLLALVATILAVACHSPYQRCKSPLHLFGGSLDQALSSGTYDVAPTLYTAKGIAVDSSGQAVDLVAIDALTDEVEACLARAFPGGVLPDAVYHAGSCERPSFTPFRRECLTVKVPRDWFVGVSGYQLLPHGNGGSCEEKGHGPGKCFYRATIQDSTTIVVPPKLGLYADPLLKIMTGCHLPWSSAELSACIMSHETPQATIARLQ